MSQLTDFLHFERLFLISLMSGDEYYLFDCLLLYVVYSLCDPCALKIIDCLYFCLISCLLALIVNEISYLISPIPSFLAIFSLDN